MVQPLYYFPCVFAFADLLNQSTISFDANMPFKRSSFRNRLIIAAADGPIQLSIPVVGGRSIKSIYREVEIDYKSNWQRDHFRTLCTAYGNSPFFLFYRDELEQLFQKKPRLLFEWNLLCIEWVLKKLKINLQIMDIVSGQSDDTILVKADQFSPQNYTIHSSKINVLYQQVFEEKTGFLPNLSILDLLFNEGSHSKQVLLNIFTKLPSNTSV
jgi:hypothetical protein